MKISMNWLRKFVDIDETPEQIADIITHLAFECDGIERVTRHIDGVVVGKVLESNPHPNADRLSLTKVDVGSEILSIVCGASNCSAGLTVAVAKPGVTIGDITIEPRKLRGEMSHGMILSEREMNISDEGKGILELTDAYQVGSLLTSEIEIEDAILDFEITVNRPDALSHLGIARELAAHFKRPLRYPSRDIVEVERPAADKVRIEIETHEYAPRYVARVVEGVKVAPSPLWMKSLLHALGQRPINNIVDVTNYVLFELGHPLHAFDYHLVKDGQIIVRMGTKDEKLKTLDDKDRLFGPNDILITDPEKAIGVGGVMGGANTEVGDDTKDILVEAAYFDPPTVRKTAKNQGLSTEASRRFERGADPSMPPVAAARCAELIRQLGGGEILKGHVDAYPNSIVRPSVTFRPSKAVQVLGVDITRDQAQEVFESLELSVTVKGEDELEVAIPTFRHDLEREIDLVEEVIRHVGYDVVPTAEESRVVLNSTDNDTDRAVDTALDTMVAMGFREAVCSGMTASVDQEAFKGELKYNCILKPINPDMNAYRASMVPALLRVVEHNLNRGMDHCRFVEVGQNGGTGWLGVESGQRMHAAFVVTGPSLPGSYDRSENPFDLADLKGVIEGLAQGLSLDNALAFSYDTPSNLEAGVTLRDATGSPVFFAGLLQAKVAAAFGIEVPVYIGEIDLERWIQSEERDLNRPGLLGKYKRFSRFPASTRDAAFLVPGSVQAEEILKRIRENAGNLLEEVELFDLYEGKPLEKGERSLAFRLVFRAPDRTLTDSEIDKSMTKVIASVQELDNVRLRSAQQ